ncbi:MAG: CNNM domain-containing protein [candidate division WOR-3 bacterium]|jgi:CBS domain containing-hemolysin-like protein
MLEFIIPLLLSISVGIFTASETGLVSIEKIKIIKAKREKKKWAIRLYRFLQTPERFFSTILVCENFIIVVASTLYAEGFVKLMGENGIIVATITLSLFSMFFGQFVPKSIALAHPMSTMSVLSNVIYYIEIFMYPVVWLYASIAKLLAMLFRSGSKPHAIQRLDIVHAMGEYEERASRLASRLFNFSKRRVGEVMIPLNSAFVTEKAHELETIRRSGGRIYTRIPVYEVRKDNIIGVFNIKDYLYSETITLRDPFFVKMDERCMTFFLIMKQKGEHMAIVTDKEERQVGIVTLEDLIEELVGEIRDER